MVTQDIAERVRSYMQHQAGKPRESIVDLVTTSQQRYLDVVGGLSDDVAARKPAADEWSVRELTRHVISAQDGVADIVGSISRGQAPDAGERRPGMMLADDSRPFAELVDQLRTVNARMIETIRDVPADPNTEMTAKHPFFGELNCLEWAVFQRVHDEDHVQHAGKILAAVGG